jgi:hypothetical protein
MKCWIVRYGLSFHLEDRREEPAWVESHLRHCQPCREYLQSQRQLGAHLRAQAASQRETAPAYFKARVLHAVSTQEHRSTRQLPGHSWSYYLSISTAAACVVVAGCLLLWQLPNRAQAPQLPPLNAAWLAQGTNRLVTIANLEAPLEREMQFVVDDAKTALYAVADGVLPAGIWSAARQTDR